MMSQYSKFGVDTFNTYWIMATLKFLNEDYDSNNVDENDYNLVITASRLFLRNRQAEI